MSCQLKDSKSYRFVEFGLVVANFVGIDAKKTADDMGRLSRVIRGF
jgi:hypothetical protein